MHLTNPAFLEINRKILLLIVPFITIGIIILSRYYQHRGKAKTLHIIMYGLIDLLTILLLLVIPKSGLSISFLAVAYLYINGIFLGKEKSMIALLWLLFNMIIIYMIIYIFAFSIRIFG